MSAELIDKNVYAQGYMLEKISDAGQPNSYTVCPTCKDLMVVNKQKGLMFCYLCKELRAVEWKNTWHIDKQNASYDVRM